MKITKQRLKEIIKEELTKYEREALKLDDADGPFVLRMSGKGETYFHGLDPDGQPKYGDRADAHEYSSIDKALNRQHDLKSAGEGLAEIDPATSMRLSAPTEDPWKLKRRLGLGGNVHDRLGGPRHREKK